MKIDRGNPGHWLALALFGLNSVLAAVARLFVPRPAKPVVVLYGHKLSGNLLAILEAAERTGFNADIWFLTMDRAYLRQLRAGGRKACLAGSPGCISVLARASVVISDHGLHSLGWWPGRTGVRFVDVWHGIPFKGFDAANFRLQHRYDEVWVASPLMADIYVRRFGFDPDRVVVTGYARTDLLSRDLGDREAVLRKLGLQDHASSRLVLFAPTWKQDAHDRSLFPFGLAAEDFLHALAGQCQALGAVLLVRQHLNVGSDAARHVGHGMVSVPFSSVPETEQLLSVTDVLVCDWSSIAFDFLVRGKPTIFLDVPAPFAKGFTLGPEYRFGPVVSDMEQLLAALREALGESAGSQPKGSSGMVEAQHAIYGGYADGNAAARCLDRLHKLLPARA